MVLILICEDFHYVPVISSICHYFLSIIYILYALDFSFRSTLSRAVNWGQQGHLKKISGCPHFAPPPTIQEKADAPDLASFTSCQNISDIRL